MQKYSHDKEETRRRYLGLFASYEKLGTEIEVALRGLLGEKDIDFLDIVHRTKDFDSFWGKISRKHYADPFAEIEDICGVRIICYHYSDLDRAEEIIRREFSIQEYVPKEDLLKPNEFGYRSRHFVVSVEPNGSDNLKAEIQLRTILEHAWAAIEHKLQYKTRGGVPQDFSRELSQLAALFEIADRQFVRAGC